MNLLTEMLAEQSWRLLTTTHQNDNCFDSFEDYQEAIETKCREVKGDGRRSFLCRISTDRCFDPSNIAIVNVSDGDAWQLEKVTRPFFRVDPPAPCGEVNYE